MDDYVFEEFTEGAEKIVQNDQINKLTQLVETHSKELEQIQHTLDESLSEVWNAFSDPISLDVQSYEQTNIFDLIKTNLKNECINKSITVFSNLCLEIQKLKDYAMQNLYPHIKLFGEGISISDPKNEGQGQIEFGKMLPFIQDLSYFVERGYEVGKRTIGQLASIYCQPNKQNEVYVQTFMKVHLNTVFDHIADLLVVFLTLDELILSNSSWLEGYKMYFRMVRSIKHDPAQFGTDEDDLWQLDKKLLALKSQLFEGRIYQNFVEADFEEGVLPIKKNVSLKKELNYAIESFFNRLQGSSGARSDANAPKSFMNLCCLYVFYLNLFRGSAVNDSANKVLFEKLWNFHTQIPIVHLYLDTLWFSTDFLQRSAPFMMPVIKKPELANASKRQYATSLSTNLITRTKTLYLQVCLWMIRTESNLTNFKANVKEMIASRLAQLMAGIQLATRASLLFKETWFLHITLGAPFKPQLVPYLIQSVEMLKAIQATFHRRSALFGEAISFISEQLSFDLQRRFEEAQKMAPRKQTNTALDIIAALTIAKQMLSGPPTRQRRVILKLSLHIILQDDIFNPEQQVFIRDTLKNLEMLAEFQTSLKRVTDCSFLYWARDVLSVYWKILYDTPHLANKIQYFVVALKDSLPLLKQAIHIDPEKLIKDYKEEAWQGFHSHIIHPLCLAVEKDLREHIHSHLGKIAERNPFKVQRSHIEKFFDLKPILFLDRTVHIKGHVIHYLDKIFYNLPAINIKNWKVYAEMRTLAKEKYDLDLLQVDLAGETAEQDIDLLEIMRGIRSFTAYFHYNINNQIFIERTTEENIGKSMKCINTSDISNSIRRHGTGIITTSVNFIYLFIREKFVTFSQFLFDDYIRSALLSEITWFENNKKTHNNRYPFSRALEFSKAIKQLGTITSPSGEKLTFLDQFRMLITHVGNAMGYIRMIRSGGFKFVSNAIKFVPDLKDLLLFEQLVKQEHLSEETSEASHNLDLAIDTLVSNFAEGTEYFSLLVKQFAGDLRSEENAHLKNFYIFLPALMVNFIEYILAGKNKLLKKRPGGFFTDDGFAIGVAYILQVLGQFKDFDSLHWFEEVDSKTKSDLQKVKKQAAEMTKAKKEDKETIQVTLRTKQDYADETNLLQYSFSGARIFFKQEKEFEPEQKEESNNENNNNNNNNNTDTNNSSETPQEEAPEAPEENNTSSEEEIY